MQVTTPPRDCPTHTCLTLHGVVPPSVIVLRQDRHGGLGQAQGPVRYKTTPPTPLDRRVKATAPGEGRVGTLLGVVPPSVVVLRRAARQDRRGGLGQAQGPVRYGGGGSSPSFQRMPESRTDENGHVKGFHFPSAWLGMPQENEKKIPGFRRTLPPQSVPTPE